MLGEVTEFELWQRAVRNQFQQGKTIGSLLFGVGCLVGVVVLVLVLARLQAGWNRRDEKAKQDSHPQRLYTHLIYSLGFTAAQRQLLEALARASTLTHPTALLVSDILFDRGVAQWEKQHGEVRADSRHIEERRALAFARSRLFPEGRGMVQSSSTKR